MPKNKPAAADRRAEIEPPAPFAEVYSDGQKAGEINFNGRVFHCAIEAGGPHLRWVGAVAKRSEAVELVRRSHSEFWKCLTAACRP